MANIAIFRINYKSDFILTLNSDAGWMTPFCIKFWTGAPSQAYFVGFDGTTYTHCAPVDGEPTKLLVQFDDHHLPIGDLKFQIGYHFTVADFPTSIEDEVINQAAVIIDNDGEQQQVMLDFNGETAPEIEFSLPAYANEAQRIANEAQRIANEEQRIATETQRIANEEQRISQEQTRQQNEVQRIVQEQARVTAERERFNDYAKLKVDAIAATDAANSAADLSNEKAQLATDNAQLAADKAALAQSASALATEKAQLATDKAALAQSAATLANEKAALAQQKAEYATAQGDYAKAQGDYAKAQAGVIPTDVTRTQTDATFVNGNHDPLFYLRQANSSLAGLMTAAGYTKLNDMPSAQEVNAGLAYDVSVLHPTSGVNGGSTYASLSAALAVIPQDKRKGGMTVKFVLSSDNNYVQYRYMKSDASTVATFTNVANWQGVDETPTAGSQNLVTSGGVNEALSNIGFLNINAYNNKSDSYATRADALNAVPTSYRKDGLVVEYLLASEWKKEIRVGGGSGWTNDYYWRELPIDRLQNFFIKGDITLPQCTVTEGYYISTAGAVTAHSSYLYTSPIQLKKGETIISYVWASSGISSLYRTNQEGSEYHFLAEGGSSSPFYKYTAQEDCYVGVCGQKNYYKVGNICIYKTDDSIEFEELEKSIERLCELDEYANLIEIEKCKSNLRINGVTGLEVTQNGYYVTDYVPLKAGTKYYTSSTILKLYYAFYDKNKNYISGVNTGSGILADFTTPSGCAYGRFSFGSEANKNSGWISRVKVLNSLDSRTLLKTFVNIQKTPFSSIEDINVKSYGNIIDRSKITQGKYINSTGDTGSSSDFACTDFCLVEPNTTYKSYKIQNFYAAFYDENKVLIKHYSTSDTLPNPFTTPANAKYARFSLWNRQGAQSTYGHYEKDVCWVAPLSETQNAFPQSHPSIYIPNLYSPKELGVNPCDYPENEISVFNKILCIGDSLMEGAENYKGTPSLSIETQRKYSIPVFLKRLSGVDTTNMGKSGLTTQEWYTQSQSSADIAGHDACIIQIGINDWLSWETDQDAGIETMLTYLGNIVDLVVSQNAGDTGSGGSHVYVNKPKIFVATIFPALSYLRNSHGLSVDVLNDAIRSFVSGRNDCILIDMATYSHTYDQMAFNRGHLTAIGYRQAARDYKGIISKYIHDNAEMFVDVAFIGSTATQFEYSSTMW